MPYEIKMSWVKSKKCFDIIGKEFQRVGAVTRKDLSLIVFLVGRIWLAIGRLFVARRTFISFIKYVGASPWIALKVIKKAFN